MTSKVLMRSLVKSLCILASLASPAVVFAEPKDCYELQAEIHQRIREKGVEKFELQIVDVENVADAKGKVVGSCNGGKKRIVYRRG